MDGKDNKLMNELASKSYKYWQIGRKVRVSGGFFNNKLPFQAFLLYICSLMRKFFLLPLFVSALGLFFSCKKDKLITDPSVKLEFSQDSVLFDTIFTTLGSTTKFFKVYNNNSQRINISNIRLARGDASPYRINADGVPGKSINDIEIDAHDSIFLFVEVTVDPVNQNNPLVIRDSILFETNGNLQDVDLEAFGQDAYFHLPDNKIVFLSGGVLYYGYEPCSSTWLADKPHVVFGYRVVDSTCTLTIDPGAKVHFHQNGGIWVLPYGTIKVNGQFGQEVIFQGDRLEPEYADLPGQWDRIWINEGSKNNVINYAILKNGFIGIQHEVIENLSAPMKLNLNNTIIQNMSGWGIFTRHGNITGYNDLVSNCGKNLALFSLGGSYKFYHSTFANFWNKEERTDVAVYLNDYDAVNGGVPMDSCYFINCIIDGSLGNELSIDSVSPGIGFNYVFENTLVRTTVNTGGTRFISCVVNQGAGFLDPNLYDFRINSGSGGKDKGKVSVGALYSTDLKNSSRTADTAPDCGAYEN
jgi:hypothetical protein